MFTFLNRGRRSAGLGGRVLATLAAGLVFPCSGLAGEAPPVPARVATTSLCADVLAVTVLPPQRVVAVSQLAYERRLSMVVDKAGAAGLPAMPASAEAYLWAGADMVVGNNHGDTSTLSMMQRLGTQVLRVPSLPDLESNLRQAREVAHRLGAGVAGDALDREMRARLDAVAARRPAEPVAAAYYRPDGGSAGLGAFIDEAMDKAGYRNLAAQLGQKGWGRLDLELLVMNEPKALVMAFFDAPGFAASRRFINHPAFRAMKDRVTAIDMPGPTAACGDWPLVAGVEFLAAARPRMTGEGVP